MNFLKSTQGAAWAKDQCLSLEHPRFFPLQDWDPKHTLRLSLPLPIWSEKAWFAPLAAVVQGKVLSLFPFPTTQSPARLFTKLGPWFREMENLETQQIPQVLPFYNFPASLITYKIIVCGRRPFSLPPRKVLHNLRIWVYRLERQRENTWPPSLYPQLSLGSPTYLSSVISFSRTCLSQGCLRTILPGRPHPRQWVYSSLSRALLSQGSERAVSSDDCEDHHVIVKDTLLLLCNTPSYWTFSKSTSSSESRATKWSKSAV